MKKYTQKLLKTIPYIIIAVLVGVTAVYAGNLTPPGSVANTMYSLEDIYNLANGTPISEGTGEISTTPGTVEGTGKTLTEVYNAVSSALNPPALVWQTDPNKTLCWSYGQYEIDNGCVVDAGFIDASEAQDGSLLLGAVEYCQYLNSDGSTLATTAQNVWHLPTIQEFTSITDYTRFNSATVVTGFIADTYYWSSTQLVEFPNVAWYWNTWSGYIGDLDGYGQYSVRCAR